MSNQNIEDNHVNEAGTSCEGASPGGCPTDEQRELSPHQGTAKRRWSKEINAAVMVCYFLGYPRNDNEVPTRVYRKRMHGAWSDRHPYELSEQSLCDRTRTIIKNV